MTTAAHTAVVGTVLCLLALLPSLTSSPNCDHHHGNCHNYPYLPAPPGTTPTCAKPGQTYCEKIDNYPTQLIRYLIGQWGYDYTTLLSDESRDDFNYRFARSNTKALANPGLNRQSPARPSRPRRQADNSGTDTVLCPTTRRFVMPKAAMNNEGNWMYTVNINEVDDRYTQLVGTESCVSNRCNGLCAIPNGYTSRCEQQYVQKRLVALEPSGNQLYTEVFWFPHCCVCQITQIG